MTIQLVDQNIDRVPALLFGMLHDKRVVVQVNFPLENAIFNRPMDVGIGLTAHTPVKQEGSIHVELGAAAIRHDVIGGEGGIVRVEIQLEIPTKEKRWKRVKKCI